jgi:osmotically-inducible protein OsmY
VNECKIGITDAVRIARRIPGVKHVVTDLYIPDGQ